jgi:hypothetical protein
LVLGVLGFLLLVFTVGLQFMRLRGKRQDQESLVEREVYRARPPIRPSVDETENRGLRERVAQLESEVARLEKASEARAVPGDPSVESPSVPPAVRGWTKEERLRWLRGAEGKLAGGDVAGAESGFLRSLPESLPHLVLTSLVLGDYGGAMVFLARSAGEDAHWYKRVDPRSVLGSEERYRELRARLEARVRQDPLDAEAKVLLAYLYYHEKGTNHAQALLVEALGVDPGLLEATDFLESLAP